jgi:hypothetical protein
MLPKRQHLPSHVPLQVPCTIKTTYSCNKVTTEENTMVITTNGVLNAVDSALRITYGPQVSGAAACIMQVACCHAPTADMAAKSCWERYA